LAGLYGQKDASKPSAAASLSVPAHRFGVSELNTIVNTGVFTQELVTAKTAEWTVAGLDFVGAVGALLKTNADVDYEQLECLGLDEGIPERLVGTFRIKRPLGYSGDLCHPGSQEYVAFWADWDNTCEWTYLSTVKVNVHDIPSIPKDGLCYTAILPVDVSKIRQSCKKPKIARVRAVLSWSVQPSTTDPNALNFYGNRLDAHVQINPSEPGTPENPEIRNIGGIPVEFIDTYTVSDNADTERRHGTATDQRPKFAELQRELVSDLIPRSEEYGPGRHPFDQRYLRRNTLMMFNLVAYSRMLLSDFAVSGGKIEIAEFHTPAELAALRQKTLINATGYGSRALFDDQSITPVRGQLARLIPQPEVNYGLFYKGVSFVPRRDGLVFQAVGEDDYSGFNDATAEPDPAEAAFAVNTIATLFNTG